jgi:hypothetical protein
MKHLRKRLYFFFPVSADSWIAEKSASRNSKCLAQGLGKCVHVPTEVHEEQCDQGLTPTGRMRGAGIARLQEEE